MPPGLGPDSTTCTTAFIDSMRAQMFATNPDDPSIQNLELPEVRRNFAPLGEAVYRIASQQARVVSDLASDPLFWQWIGELQASLTMLVQFRRALVEAFEGWNPADAAGQSFRASVLALGAASEAAPAEAPAALAARIE